MIKITMSDRERIQLVSIADAINRELLYTLFVGSLIFIGLRVLALLLNLKAIAQTVTVTFFYDY